ncbi:MAG: tetratricopeptide repeat protein [Candidatus Reddybacter sp.]
MTKTIVLNIIVIIFSVSTLNALAFYPENDKDFSLLPAYCKAKLKPSSPGEQTRWKKRIGEDFKHVHHFCAALHSYNWTLYNFPSTKSEKSYKLYALRGAVGHAEYMEEHLINKDFVLLPSIYLLKARALADLDKTAEAITYFNKSIAANKKYTKAYIALAKFHLKLGNKTKALATIEQGLKHKPSSKSLKRRHRELISKSIESP